MTVTLAPVSDVSQIAVRHHGLPIIAVTPGGLRGEVGPAGFIKAGATTVSSAEPGRAARVARGAADDSNDFVRAIQESMDLRDQGHA